MKIHTKFQKFQSKKLKHLKLPFNEAELLEKMTKKTAHVDIIAKPLKGEF